MIVSPRGPIAARLFGWPFLAIGQRHSALAFAERAAAFLQIDVDDRRIAGGEVSAAGVVVEGLSEGDED